MTNLVIDRSDDKIIGYVLIAAFAALILLMNLLSYAVYFMGIPACQPISGMTYIKLNI